MAKRPITRRVALDTGALIKYANQDRETLALFKALMDEQALLLLPSPVLVEALRGGPKDAPVNRVVNGDRFEPIVPTMAAARNAGALLGAAKAEKELAMDAFIVATALEGKAEAILTVDQDDITRLAPAGLAVLPA